MPKTPSEDTGNPQNPQRGTSTRLEAGAQLAHERVQTSLKNILEAELTRRQAAVDVGTGVGPAAYFSRGVIFSKAGNGTPFSRGVIFSKTGSQVLPPEEIELERALVQEMTSLDQVRFQEFANRLTALKDTKSRG